MVVSKKISALFLAFLSLTTLQLSPIDAPPNVSRYKKVLTLLYKALPKPNKQFFINNWGKLLIAIISVAAFFHGRATEREKNKPQENDAKGPLSPEIVHIRFPPQSKTDLTAPIGLPNSWGNACYFNSVLQLIECISLLNDAARIAFNNLDELHKKEITEKNNQKGFFNSFLQFFQPVEPSYKRNLWYLLGEFFDAYNNQSLKKLLAIHDQLGNNLIKKIGTGQQDAAEQLGDFLNNLYENPPDYKLLDTMTDKDWYQAVIKSLGYYFSTVYLRDKPKHKKKGGGLESDFIFKPPFINQNNLNSPEKLQEIIDNCFTQPVNIPKEGTSIQKSHTEIFSIHDLPEQVLIAPRRYTNLNQKIKKPVLINKDESGNYVISFEKLASEENKQSSLDYYLRAVIIHSEVMGGGHYRTLKKLESSGWFLCDDSDVEKIDSSEQVEKLFGQGYVFLFDRKNKPSNFSESEKLLGQIGSENS